MLGFLSEQTKSMGKVYITCVRIASPAKQDLLFFEMKTSIPHKKANVLWFFSE